MRAHAGAHACSCSVAAHTQYTNVQLQCSIILLHCSTQATPIIAWPTPTSQCWNHSHRTRSTFLFTSSPGMLMKMCDVDVVVSLHAGCCSEQETLTRCGGSYSNSVMLLLAHISAPKGPLTRLHETSVTVREHSTQCRLQRRVAPCSRLLQQQQQQHAQFLLCTLNCCLHSCCFEVEQVLQVVAAPACRQV